MYLQSIKENIHVSWVSTKLLCRENTNNYKKILNNITVRSYQHEYTTQYNTRLLV